MFSDAIVAWIRTVVPATIGAGAAWLTVKFGIEVSAENLAVVAVSLSVVFTGLYYATVRWIGARLPWVENLLGHKATPKYL